MLNRKTLYATGILTLLVCALIVFNRPKTTYGREDLKLPFGAGQGGFPEFTIFDLSWNF